jgi:site-specific DNA recombinase
MRARVKPRTRTAPVPEVRRCAIYTRKSTSQGLEQDFNSLDAQREACEQYIANRADLGWQLVTTRYDDGGFTGSNLERPAFQQLMEDVEARNIDIVVVYKVDRLSRSLLDFAQVMHRFEQADVAFVSVTQNFSTADAMGRLTLNMLMSFAEFEREMIAERTRDKMAAARRKGKWVGGLAPLGYDAVDGKLVVNEDEATQVREIFRIYDEHRSLLETAEVLNARGWRTKRWNSKTGRCIGGLPWDKKSVSRVLTNVLYLGQIFYQGEFHEGEHAAIVGREVFDRVQKWLAVNAAAKGAARRARSDYLLCGLLRCQVCGSAMTARSSSSRGREYRYYVCTKVEHGGAGACPVRYAPAGAIEDFVVQRVRAIATQPELLSQVLATMERRRRDVLPALQQEHARLEAEQVRCRQEARDVLRAIGGDKAGQGSVAAEHLAELEAHAATIVKRLGELKEEIATLESRTVTTADVASAIALFDPIWDLLQDRERSRILNLLLERIEYDGVKGELLLTFYALGITRLAAEAASVEVPAKEAA